MEDKRLLLTQLVASFVASSPANKLLAEEPIWDTPLVSFAAGDDPYFEFFKEDIGDFYLSPLEMLKGHYSDLAAEPSELTVMSWILPQTRITRDENAQMKTHPSERWARAKAIGEEFNRTLAGHVVSELRSLGYDAVAPMLSPLFAAKTSEKYSNASTWSERHTAFVAGLGTFGLCDGLITPVGKAMRCGSVVVRLKVEPTPRPYTKHNEYCLYYSSGACYACAERCPVGAIGPDGHDKRVCSDYQSKVLVPFVRDEYGVEASCCGLCQTGVPCESGIPKR